jgi:hypothetical protein
LIPRSSMSHDGVVVDVIGAQSMDTVPPTCRLPLRNPVVVVAVVVVVVIVVVVVVVELCSETGRYPGKSLC